MNARLILRSGLLFVLVAAAACAQQFPFQLLVTQGSTTIIVANGSSLSLNVPVGEILRLDVRATYTGSGKVTIAQSPQIFGFTAFTATLDGTVPLTLNQGEAVTFHIVYKPTSSAASTALFTLPFTETIPPVTGNTPTVIQNAISLGLTGTAPAFTLSYVLSTELNVIPIAPGGTLLFSPTLVNTTTRAQLNITNSGSGSGQITGLTLTGAAYKLVGLPFLPNTLNAGTNLAIFVDYKPTAVGIDTGQIRVSFDSGSPITINLQGTGTASAFTYTLISGDAPTPLVPPGPLTLPDTKIGETSSVVVRVQNTGTANGTLNAPAIAGQGYSLSDLPLFPQVLKPNDSFTFSVNFTPLQPGTQKGNLVIGSDLISLVAQGLGPQLKFSYVSEAGTINLGSTGQVVFPPIIVTQSEQVTFIVTNSGTIPASVSNVGIGEAKSPFSVSGLPHLPTTLDPGASFQFAIVFAPTTTGFSNGTLRIDTTVIGLVGSGDPPPPLPAYTIQGPSGNATPQTQSAVRLKLAAPYPVALVGTLTLTTSGNFVNDPAVQFSTGGRVVIFTIPANSVDANFAGQGPQVFLQTGTVASTIALTPVFLTQAGGVDVTPANAATLQFNVPSAAPTLLSVVPVGQTANGFVLNVTGFSTTRSLTTLTVQFTPAAGVNLQTSTVTIDVRSAASTWFQTTTSQGFGGLFTIAVPFTLQGTPLAGQTLLQTIASVSATVANEAGTSSSLQAKFQ